jgi:hypothetical protein
VTPVEHTAPEPIPAEDDRPLAPRLPDRTLETLDRGAIDHRAEVDVALGGIAHPDGAGLLHQPVEERLRHPPVHVDARGGTALLVLEPEGGAHDTLGRGVQIRTRGDDGRVLPAELQQAGLDPARAQPGMDPETDALGAGEHDPVDCGVLPERIADRFAATGEIVEHSRRQPGIPVDLRQPQAGPGRLLGRLVDHGIACHECRRRHPGRKGQREVERRDADEHAVGPEHIGVPLDGGDPPHRTHEAVGLLELSTVVVDQVGGFLGISHGLEAALPDFQRHERGEIVLPLPDELGGPVHDGDALLPGPSAPVPLRRLRPADGQVHLGGSCRREAAQEERGVDR